MVRRCQCRRSSGLRCRFIYAPSDVSDGALESPQKLRVQVPPLDYLGNRSVMAAPAPLRRHPVSVELGFALTTTPLLPVALKNFETRRGGLRLNLPDDPVWASRLFLGSRRVRRPALTSTPSKSWLTSSR